MNAASRIRSVIQADPLRWRILGVVRALCLPDCWVGAGLVRNAVRDHLHQRLPAPLNGDVDVIWHDPSQADPAADRKHEAVLQAAEPSILWSVKNQARMHTRNSDAPYMSSIEAMRCWPETATAIAVRRNQEEGFDVAAPFGLDDLLSLTLRPTPRFAGEERHIYEERLRTKRWAAAWPLLKEV